jgi:hypothetical protein
MFSFGSVVLWCGVLNFFFSLSYVPSKIDPGEYTASPLILQPNSGSKSMFSSMVGVIGEQVIERGWREGGTERGDI